LPCLALPSPAEPCPAMPCRAPPCPAMPRRARPCREPDSYTALPKNDKAAAVQSSSVRSISVMSLPRKVTMRMTEPSSSTISFAIGNATLGQVVVCPMALDVTAVCVPPVVRDRARPKTADTITIGAHGSARTSTEPYVRLRGLQSW